MLVTALPGLLAVGAHQRARFVGIRTRRPHDIGVVLRELGSQTENRELLGMVVHQGRKLVADLKDREGRFELMTTSSKEKLPKPRPQ